MKKDENGMKRVIFIPNETFQIQYTKKSDLTNV